MLRPPSEGGFHDTTIPHSDATDVCFTYPGTLGITYVRILDIAPLPHEFSALSWKLYSTPGVNPVTVNCVSSLSVISFFPLVSTSV